MDRGEDMADDPKFEYAVAVVLEHEGGFVDDPNDPGGATNWGISLRYLRRLGVDVGDVDQDGDVDVEDIAKMPRGKAIEIYRRQFWDQYGYGKIDDLQLATKVFDLSVNMGPQTAHKLLQRALHAAGQRYVVVDGIIGPQTLDAVNTADPRLVLGALRAEAAGYYRGLVASRPELGRFLAGWENRAYS